MYATTTTTTTRDGEKTLIIMLCFRLFLNYPEVVNEAFPVLGVHEARHNVLSGNIPSLLISFSDKNKKRKKHRIFMENFINQIKERNKNLKKQI